MIPIFIRNILILQMLVFLDAHDLSRSGLARHGNIIKSGRFASSVLPIHSFNQAGPDQFQIISLANETIRDHGFKTFHNPSIRVSNGLNNPRLIQCPSICQSRCHHAYL